MALSSLFTEKPTHSLSDFDFLHDPKDKRSRLGVGSFATVKLAREKKTNKLIALKMADLEASKTRAADLHSLKTEIHVHKRIDHPNIIKYHGYTSEGYCVYIILDYAEKGNLYAYLQKKKALSSKEVFKFFYQTCQAIKYLHSQDVMHRDIKPENLLLDSDLNIKLCDFGWAAERVKDKRTTFCGTYEYMAPEIIHKRPYDYRIDIWSLGILLYELIHNEAPYKGRSLSEIWNSLSKGPITYSSSIDTHARDLIQKILKINPSERLSISQILSHPYVRQFIDPKETPTPLEFSHNICSNPKRHEKTKENFDTEPSLPTKTLEDKSHISKQSSALCKKRPLEDNQHPQQQQQHHHHHHQHSESSGRFHTKSSPSVTSLTISDHLADHYHKKSTINNSNLKRKMTGSQPTFSPSHLKRSLQSIVSRSTRIGSPDHLLTEILTTTTSTNTNTTKGSSVSSSLGIHHHHPTSSLGYLNAYHYHPTENNNSTTSSSNVTPVIQASSNTPNTLNNVESSLGSPLLLENVFAFPPMSTKRLFAVTTTHTRNNSRLQFPIQGGFGNIAVGADSSEVTPRAPVGQYQYHHQKNRTLSSVASLSRRMFTEQQEKVSVGTPGGAQYKGMRYLGKGFDSNTPNTMSNYESRKEIGGEIMGGLVSPMGWGRNNRVVGMKNFKTEVSVEESGREGLGIKRNFENIMSNRPDSNGNSRSGKKSEGGNSRGKVVFKMMKENSSNGGKVSENGLGKARGHNKENRSEGEKNLKQFVSLEKLRTPREVRLQSVYS